jgi:hypothetical protein
MLRMYADSAVEITVRKPKRSSLANRYYWGVVLATIRRAALESGQTVSSDALHGYFKSRYLDPDVTVVASFPIVTYSSKDLDSTSFFDYVENIRHDPVVMALGCHVPDPSEPFDSFAIGD